MEEKMKIAFLITAYNKSNQLIELINCLAAKNGYDNIFVHFDLKGDLNAEEIKTQTNSSINVVSKYNVFWGGFNQLQSITSLIDLAKKKDNYDFVILLSGQDLPITTYDYLKKFLSSNIGKSFITSYKLPHKYWNHKQGLGRIQWFWFMDYMNIRGIQRFHQISHYIFDKLNLIRNVSKGIEFYGGSDWWILPGEVAEYCLNEFQTNNKLTKCFKYSFIPTEMYFQTVINNSKYVNTITNDSKRYIIWSDTTTGHPDLLTLEDQSLLINSNCLFARKFDLEKNPEIFNYFINNF